MLDEKDYHILVCPKCYTEPENKNITKDLIYHCCNCDYIGKPLEAINSSILRMEIMERNNLLENPRNIERLVDSNQLKLEL